jgi:alpha-tubulin suppressor-like RCC1 family protein
LWSWGTNQNGKLGIGNTTNYSSPKQVGLLTGWTAIGGGGYHAIGIASV